MTNLRIIGARPMGDGAHAHSDGLAIRDGVITAEAPQATDQVVDVRGAYISPGFIDLHAHVFPAAADLGIDADKVGIDQGVTTLVDAGSTGARDLPRFLDDVVRSHHTRVLAWLNIAPQGLIDGLHELVDLNLIDTAAATEALIAHPEVLIGIKARMSASVVGHNGIKPLQLALEAAENADTPVMIHTGNEPPRMIDSAELLRRGDVISHAYHGKPGGLLDAAGVRPQIRNAMERGVRLDVGHGESSFSLDVFRRALRGGAAPFTTSTDIHHGNVAGVVGSLAHTMSKLLACGMSLDSVVHTVTDAPAAVIGRPGLGTLAPGTPADLTVFDIFRREISMADSEGHIFTHDEEIVPRICVRAGVIHECR